MVKPSSVRFAQLKAFLEGIGFVATQEEKGWVFEHAQSDAAFHFRPYRRTSRVYMPDLLRVRSHLDARGMMSEDTFDELLSKAPA